MTSLPEPPVSATPPPFAFLNNPFVRDPVVFLLFATICFAAFGPARNRFFAGDQVSYLAELNGSRSLYNVVRFWDYSDSRKYAKGDEALFRPMLFALLGIEYDIFTWHPLGWNLVNFAAHILVVFLLYKLLAMMAPLPLAVALAALFAVLNSNVELVLWNHLGGYIASLVCMLLAFIAARKLIEGESENRWLGIFIASGFIGSMFYEIAAAAIFFAAIYVLILRFNQRTFSKKLLFCCLVPTFIFGLLDLAHLPFTTRLFEVDTTRGFAHLTPLTLLTRSINACCNWLQEVSFPTDYTYRIQPELRFYKFAVDKSHVFQNTIIFIASILFLVRAWFVQPRWGWVAMIIPAIFSLAAAVCFGRGEFDLAHTTTYYNYIFSLLFILLLCGFLRFDRLSAPAMWIIVGFIIALAGFNFMLTRDTSMEVAEVDQECEQYFGSIANVVDEHRSDPGFSFNINEPKLSVDPPVSMVVGYPWDRPQKLEIKLVSEIIFAPYYNREHPQHTLNIRQRD